MTSMSLALGSTSPATDDPARGSAPESRPWHEVWSHLQSPVALPRAALSGKLGYPILLKIEARAQTSSGADVEANRRVALQFIDRVFVHGEAAAVDELAAEDFTAHTFGPKPVGRDFLKEAIPRVAEGISDPHFRIDDVVAEGDRVAVRLTSSATHTGTFMGQPASGNRYSISEIHIFRMRDGRVIEHWHVFDRLALMEQLKPKA
jgi:steroid delta-isomerase-like uncharacterized protein